MSDSISLPSSPSRWLFGPSIDLLVGCGLGYFVVFSLLIVAGPSVKAAFPLPLLPLLALVAGGPHYGATLIRVYRRGEDRRRYASVAVGWSLVLVVAFFSSFRIHALGTILVTLYLLWSPWHYAGQNFGLAIMFMGRRGIDVDKRSRSLLRAVVLLPFMLFVLQTNGEATGSFWAAGLAALKDNLAQPFYRSIPIGIPTSIQSPAMILLLVVYAGALVTFLITTLRRHSLRDIAPTLALVATQSLWFALPACARFWGWGAGLVPLDAKSSLYAFHWVAAAHGAQYLWITLYHNSRTTRGSRKRYFFLKAALIGQGIWVVPTFIFASAFNSRGAYSADLALLVAAVVNLHHFVLDGAIWKLRDGAVGRALVQGARWSTREIGGSTHTPIRLVAYALGMLVFLVEMSSILERNQFYKSTTAGDLTRAERSLERLKRLRRIDDRLYLQLGLQADKLGQTDLAVDSFERSAALRETPDAFVQIARVQAARGNWSAAADAFENAHLLTRLHPAGFLGMAQILWNAGRRTRAIEILSEGSAIHPDDQEIEEMLRSRVAKQRSKPIPRVPEPDWAPLSTSG